MSLTQTDRRRQIVDSLRPSEDRSHSNSYAEMVITTAEVGIPIIEGLNKADRMAANHTALMEASWNGKRCIGQISVADAITRLHNKKTLSCRCTIKKLRRVAQPHAYRCATCQQAMEDKESKEKKTKRR